jgi:hypothetical protein
MKKKISLSLVFFLLIGCQVFSQTYVILVKPAGSKEWGYADLKGKLIIDAKYRKCTEFSEDGFAVIYDATIKKFYFINIKGETLKTEITDFKLSEFFGFGIKGFENGFVPIEQNKKWGYLNTSGKLAIPVKYDKVTEFNSDHAVAQNGGKYLIINKQGEEIPVEVPLVDLKPFTEQLAPYKTVDDKFGFIGINGKVAIQAQYQGVGYFNAGLAWAKSDKLIGFINPKGEWVIKAQFAAAKNFDSESGLARVKVGDKWAYVNKKGEITNLNDTQVSDDFCNGLARGKKNEKIGFYNTSGNWVIQPQFDGARDFKNGYAAAKKDGKWGIIDKTGKWVIEASFDEVKDVEVVK